MGAAKVAPTPAEDAASLEKKIEEGLSKEGRLTDLQAELLQLQIATMKGQLFGLETLQSVANQTAQQVTAHAAENTQKVAQQVADKVYPIGKHDGMLAAMRAFRAVLSPEDWGRLIKAATQAAAQGS